MHACVRRTMRLRLRLKPSLPLAMKAALWTGLNMLPPNMLQMGPNAKSASTVMVRPTALAGTPSSLDRNAAICRSGGQ